MPVLVQTLNGLEIRVNAFKFNHRQFDFIMMSPSWHEFDYSNGIFCSKLLNMEYYEAEMNNASKW